MTVNYCAMHTKDTMLAKDTLLDYTTDNSLLLPLFNFCIIIPGLPLYDPSKDFTCLDGSKRLSFSNVNDDYCDCDDGSDEPGNLKY